MRLRIPTLTLGLAVVSTLAHAQQQPTTSPPAQTADTTAQVTPPAPSAADEPDARSRPMRSGASQLDQLAPHLDIEDSQLTPLPRAKRELARWQDALSMTRQRNTDLRTAYAQVEAARGRSRQILSQSLPTLVGQGSINRHLLEGEGFNIFTGQRDTIPNPNTTWDGSVALRVPILAARSWYDYGTSREALRTAELDVKEVERQVIGALAEAIVAVITAERLAEVTRVILRSALENLELNRRRARLGSANAVDVLRAEQEVERSRVEVVEANEAVFRTRESLGLALGYPHPWGVNPDIKLDQLREDARATCTQTDSVKDRPDVRAAEANVHVAERNVTSVGYSFLPTVDGETAMTYSSNDRRTANQKHLTWTIGAVLTWNLYDGGFRYGERMTAEAELVTNEQRAISTERNALIEVERAYRNVRVASINLEISERARAVARESAKLSQIKFVNGTGTSFDMVDTLRTVREAELDVTLKQFELVRAEIAAFLALANCDV